MVVWKKTAESKKSFYWPSREPRGFHAPSCSFSFSFCGAFRPFLKVLLYKDEDWALFHNIGFSSHGILFKSESSEVSVCSKHPTGEYSFPQFHNTSAKMVIKKKKVVVGQKISTGDGFTPQSTKLGLLELRLNCLSAAAV